MLVVDDHAVFADALQARLAAEPDMGPVSVAYGAGDLRNTCFASSRPSWSSI